MAHIWIRADFKKINVEVYGNLLQPHEKSQQRAIVAAKKTSREHHGGLTPVKARTVPWLNSKYPNKIIP